MALTYVTVSGTIQRPDGKAASGTVTFELDRDVLSTVDNVLVLSQPVVATLTSAGVFSVRLLALDSGVTPTNASYKVTESLADPVKTGYFDERTFYTTIASSPVTQHYADLAHLSPTRRSTLTLASLADVDVSGAADGDALSFEASSSRWHPAPGGGGGGGTVDPLVLHAPSDSTSPGPATYTLQVVDDPDNWATNALRVIPNENSDATELIVGDVGYPSGAYSRVDIVRQSSGSGAFVELTTGQDERYSSINSFTQDSDTSLRMTSAESGHFQALTLESHAQPGDPSRDFARIGWSRYSSGEVAIGLMDLLPLGVKIRRLDGLGGEESITLIPNSDISGPDGAPGWCPKDDGTLHYWDGSAWHDKTPRDGLAFGPSVTHTFTDAEMADNNSWWGEVPVYRLPTWTPTRSGTLVLALGPDNGDSDYAAGNFDIYIWQGDQPNVDYPDTTAASGGFDDGAAVTSDVYLGNGLRTLAVTAGHPYTIQAVDWNGPDGVGHTLDLSYFLTGLAMLDATITPPVLPGGGLGAIVQVDGATVAYPGLPDPAAGTGHFSHVEGRITEASGDNSHAEGIGSAASADSAHAEGQYTAATDIGAHAEGYRTVASASDSHAEGTMSTASANNAHAEGMGTTASGEQAHAEGDTTVAGGLSSHAEGVQTHATGVFAHAEGAFATASGSFSHAEGGNTTAAGGGAHAEGSYTIASGLASHTEGESATASGEAAHAEGMGTIASAQGSHAEGNTTTASGVEAHAEGQNTVASGAHSHAAGTGTTAAGDASTALGQDGIVSGANSLGIGQGYRSLRYGELVVGAYAPSPDAVSAAFQASRYLAMDTGSGVSTASTWAIDVGQQLALGSCAAVTVVGVARSTDLGQAVAFRCEVVLERAADGTVTTHGVPIITVLAKEPTWLTDPAFAGGVLTVHMMNPVNALARIDTVEIPLAAF